ncbi:MAG: DUF2442 domain-containing protein [Methylococcaceae bacterium]
MIKIIRAYYLQQRTLRLYFSDNSYGDYDLQPLVDRDAELVLPLKDDAYFKQFFLELGALCWKNGLELCPDSIYQKLAEKQQLHFELNAA